MVLAIHHIAIIISSESNLELYRLLGFSEKFRKKRLYDEVVLMEGHGIELEIFIDPRHLRSEVEQIGIRHFALKVDRLEDEIKRLKSECTTQIEIDDIMTDWHGERFVFVRDSDGIVLELHE